MTFTRHDVPVKLIGVFPGHEVTLTNVETGKSITLPGGGQFHLQLRPDGSAFMLVVGQGLVPNFFVGEPGLWYQSGQLKVEFDADENPISVRTTGKLANLCDQLAR